MSMQSCVQRMSQFVSKRWQLQSISFEQLKQKKAFDHLEKTSS